jgi:hypothetical protein
LVGTIPSPTAAFSQHAVTSVVVPDSPAAGPVLVAADTASVYALSLLDGRSQTLFTVDAADAIVANSTLEESPYFRGICAGSEFYAFVLRPNRGPELSLVLRYFTREHEVESPVRFSDAPFIGPITRGSGVAVCTPSDVFIYDCRDQRTSTFALPRSFEPYMQRPSSGLNVPPGHVPFAIDSTAGWKAWIAGEERGRPGLLEIHPDGNHCRFIDAGARATVCQVEGGALCMNTGSGMTLFGDAQPQFRITGLDGAMPVAAGRSWVVHFRRHEQPASHALTVFGDGADPFLVSFDDPLCDEDSCCGTYVVDGHHLLVGYLALPRQPDQPRGLKFAHWDLQ